MSHCRRLKNNQLAGLFTTYGNSNLSHFRCPHCVQLEPVWNELATHFKHESAITIAKVRITYIKAIF